ncbi:MAG: ATP-binding protein [Chitinophagales bacterium]|nr:ATP-binding protein [Chitinophagales bacterium]
MKNTWTNPKVTIGNTAEGTFYFPRPFIEESIWEEIEKGNHVLIAAPRRVGKSSVMLALAENCPENTRCLFQNIQGIKSEAEYYRRFYELLLQCLNQFDRGLKWVAQFVKGIKIEEITLDGVKFGDKNDINFEQELKSLLTKIAESEVRVVLLLDELPEVLNNLRKQNRGEEAGNILNHLRELRQNPKLRNRLNLVLAGSVGIQHVVKAIEGRIADINDFNPVAFDPMTRTEALNYIHWATKDATVQYKPALAEYLLDQVRHYIPYFLNLMLDEINKAARRANDPAIDSSHVNLAFQAIVVNSDHFKEWKNRLNDYFEPAEKAFLMEVLVHIAHKDNISPQILYDFAIKHQLQYAYMELVHGLEHDGYLTEQAGQYRFVSPFLQAFWRRDNPIYNA